MKTEQMNLSVRIKEVGRKIKLKFKLAKPVTFSRGILTFSKLSNSRQTKQKDEIPMNSTSWHSFKNNMGFEISKNWQRYIYTTVILPQLALS